MADPEPTLPEGVAPASEPQLAAGDMVGEYRVEGMLGEGGFGSVYRALHPLIGKTAAIKVLKREFSAKGDVVSRFLSEARAVNQIRHRNIIDIFSFGVLPDGRHYYVMELLEGSTLDQYVRARGGRLPLADVLAIVRPLARALQAAHQHAISHRDLKPENVFLTVDDEGRPHPKLLDFGIAKLAGDLGAQHKTRSGIPIGTPAYMSPEQVHGRDVDHRTDIYAFGVVLFEILAGRLPFDGTSMMDVMMKHASVPAPAISSVAPWVPAELDEPLLRMLAKDPAERPPTILAAVDSLTEAAARAGLAEAQALPSLAVPSGPGAITPASLPSKSALDFVSSDTLVATDGSKTFEGTERAQHAKRSGLSVPLLAVGALLVAGAGLGAFFATRTPAVTPAASAEAAQPAAPTATAAATATATAAATTVSAIPTATVAAVTSVTLKLSVVPADAEVFRGEEKLGAASDPITLPFSADEVTLTIKRRGYLPSQLTVKPDADLAEAVVLKAIGQPKKDYTFD